MASIARAKASAAAAIRAREEERKEREAENPEEEEEDVNLVAPQKFLDMRLLMLGPKKCPVVPPEPAPVAVPVHTTKIPYSLVNIMPEPTVLAKMLNSSIGRMIVFGCTIITFGVAAVSVIDVQDFHNGMMETDKPMMFATFMALVLFYAAMPYLSEQAGMHPRSTGWKPYLVLYRFSFCLSVPALGCLALGYGQIAAFGEGEKNSGKMNVAFATPKSGMYFEAVDGFVALNLTKGVTSMKVRSIHGGNSPRLSRYRDAELLINKEPFTGLAEPTVPPGAKKLHVVAPIFNRWAPCVSRYQISSTCLNANVVVAWAYAELPSICSRFNIMSCRLFEPTLDPVYKCGSKEPIFGRQMVYPVEGLCGRAVMPPPDDVIDELSALLLQEAWPKGFMPNSSMPWIDVTPNLCIGTAAECGARWNSLGALGAGLSFLVMLCIAVPAFLDWKIDGQIREVRAYLEAKEKGNGNV